MDYYPAWKGFVAVDREFEVLAEASGDLVIITHGAEHVRPCTWSLDRLVGRCVVLLGQQCRCESILRGAPRMETLCHRTEHLPQSNRLRGRQSECPDHL